jgi:hypothetical protein
VPARAAQAHDLCNQFATGGEEVKGTPHSELLQPPVQEEVKGTPHSELLQPPVQEEVKGMPHSELLQPPVRAPVQEEGQLEECFIGSHSTAGFFASCTFLCARVLCGWRCACGTHHQAHNTHIERS